MTHEKRITASEDKLSPDTGDAYDNLIFSHIADLSGGRISTDQFLHRLRDLYEEMPEKELVNKVSKSMTLAIKINAGFVRHAGDNPTDDPMSTRTKVLESMLELGIRPFENWKEGGPEFISCVVQYLEMSKVKLFLKERGIS